MLSPSIIYIESAIDMLKNPDYMPAWLKESQIHELETIGDVRAKSVGASGLTDDFRAGYELGLATARVILKTSPALLIKSIKPEEIL